MALRKM